MIGGFEVPTIVFLLLAVLVIVRLVSVLGRKTGNERPAERYRPTARSGASDNVIPLPRTSGPEPRAGEPVATSTATPETRIKGAAPEGSELEQGLLAIAGRDSTFDPKSFLKGAKAAYEMIVMAFATGDRRQLKLLTARDVFDGFARAISEREQRGEVNDTKFIGIHKADVIDAELKDATARMTVKFTSQLITVIRNARGEVTEGDPNQVRDVTDIWTFARDVLSRDPNWKLVGTQAAN
jgi:predicted lipid-binding transport protein (Tim44 family)